MAKSSDKQKQIEFAMRWLLEFGDGPVEANTWDNNEWVDSCGWKDTGYIGEWETRGWLTEVDDRTTIISQESLDLLKGDSDAQQ